VREANWFADMVGMELRVGAATAMVTDPRFAAIGAGEGTIGALIGAGSTGVAAGAGAAVVGLCAN